MKINRTFYIGLSCLLSILCWTTITWAVPQEDITFKLTKPIDLADGTKRTSFKKSEIESIQDLPIYMATFKTATLTNKERKQIQVRTCREYDTALEQGYRPYTGTDVISSAWLKYPCRTLNLLQQAVKPKQSFLPAPEQLYDPKLLPLMLFPVITDFEQTYGYNIENDTYQDQINKGLFKVIQPEKRADVCYEGDGLRQYLTQIVRTDFNGDGTEDVLLYEAVYAYPQGSYRVFDLIILTRKSADGKFMILFQHGSMKL